MWDVLGVVIADPNPLLTFFLDFEKFVAVKVDLFLEKVVLRLTCESFDLYTANNEVVEGHPFVLGIIL